MPEGWNCGDECLLNGLYTWAQDHADQFPAGTADPGVLATTEAVEALSGLDVQYYVLVDLQGFKGLIDAVGRARHHRAARTPIGGGTSRISGLDRARGAAPRRLPRPLVRPVPAGVDELRADGAAALRHHGHGGPARPADGGAELRRHRRRRPRAS